LNAQRRILLLSFLVFATATATGADPPTPYFTDVTAEVGLDGVPVFRISVADLNGDGYYDIFIHTAPDEMGGDVLDKQFLYLNEVGDNPGDPYSRKFVDHTAGSGIRDNRSGTTDGRHSSAAIFADVDNDGDMDMFTGVYLHRNYTLNLGTNDLLLNDGNAHFSLSPTSTFHTETIWNTAGEVFLDYDNDGNIDLFIGNWYNPDSTLTLDHLYRGDGSGGFTNVTTAAGLNAATTCIYGIAAWDWNDDGYMDLFAPPYAWTVLNTWPRHWRNNGDGTFTQVQDTTDYDLHRGTLSQVASFGSIPRDYDNDGDVDFAEVLTHGGTDTGKFSGPVENVAGVYDWDWSDVLGRATEDPDPGHDGDHHLAWFDFDFDGLHDYALTESGYDNNRLYLFRQAADHTFSPVTVDSGLNDININNWTPGNVINVDFDLDGDEDLLVGLGGATGIKVYRNDVGTLNNWISITLVGAGGNGYSNKSAIGAKVQVTAGGVTQTRTVYAGDGHQGPQKPLSLAFGLGEATIVDSIIIRWPNDTMTTSQMFDVAVNQFLTIEEPCDYATDPTNLMVDKDVNDVVLTWDDPLASGWTWNVYRDGGPDPSLWGDPHEGGVTDGDLGTPGIQWTDIDAISGSTYYYLVTAVNECGETPLR
jgi:hypothetical protein